MSKIIPALEAMDNITIIRLLAHNRTITELCSIFSVHHSAMYKFLDDHKIYYVPGDNVQRGYMRVNEHAYFCCEICRERKRVSEESVMMGQCMPCRKNQQRLAA